MATESTTLVATGACRLSIHMHLSVAITVITFVFAVYFEKLRHGRVWKLFDQSWKRKLTSGMGTLLSSVVFLLGVNLQYLQSSLKASGDYLFRSRSLGVGVEYDIISLYYLSRVRYAPTCEKYISFWLEIPVLTSLFLFWPGATRADLTWPAFM